MFTRETALFLVGTALAAPLPGCKEHGDVPALAKAEDDAKLANVPSPPADGPRLVALKDGVDVFDRPSTTAKKLGELRAGASVARSNETFGATDCEGGWFAIRPRGFVCAAKGLVGVDASFARVTPAAPELARALPYRYGRAKTENVPIYARVPSSDEQAIAEPDLAKVLARGEDKEPLGTGANDVPLDPRAVPTGPPVLLPTGEGTKDGKRSGATFFTFPDEAVPVLGVGATDAKSGALRKNSGIAITGTFVVDGAAAPRRFGVTADGRLVPTDRLKPALGSTWHGIDVEKIGLPVAFVHKQGVHPFTLEKGKALKHDDELERKAALPLSGKFRTVDGIRFEETRDGLWVRSQDIVVIVKRSKFPDFATGNQKWIDVSLANQTLTAYEGKKPIYATLVSTGRDLMRDPATSASTAKGTFKVKRKVVAAPLDPREVQSSFDVLDAPWILELESGSVMTGAYWSDVVGEATMFHGIAMAPIDAHKIFAWSDPPIPEGWSGVTDAMGEATTMVNVRP